MPGSTSSNLGKVVIVLVGQQLKLGLHLEQRRHSAVIRSTTDKEMKPQLKSEQNVSYEVPGETKTKCKQTACKRLGTKDDYELKREN